ncbi:MAG: hypothetical protein HYY01_11120 [Chloroflexi bacterium]|nr:hypothetical protein [Chloroflexota bacterium]
MKASDMFGKLSAFYIALWQHLDAFWPDNRWLRLQPLPDIEVRLQSLATAHRELKDLVSDSALGHQIKSDLATVKALTKRYIQENPGPESEWFQEAGKMRSYLQGLGLRYAELASTEAVAG